MISQSNLQTFVEELYPELLDRIQESKDVLDGLAKFLSDDPPLTRERLQKPEELPETDQDVRNAGESLKPLIVDLIPEFESMYDAVRNLPESSGGEPIDYTTKKSAIESGYTNYESAHNDLIAHLRETVVVNGISRQDNILNQFSDTSDELSDRPQQAREFKDGEIPETLKTTALDFISALDDQIASTISSWQSV